MYRVPYAWRRWGREGPNTIGRVFFYVYILRGTQEYPHRPFPVSALLTENAGGVATHATLPRSSVPSSFECQCHPVHLPPHVGNGRSQVLGDVPASGTPTPDPPAHLRAEKLPMRAFSPELPMLPSSKHPSPLSTFSSRKLATLHHSSTKIPHRCICYPLTALTCMIYSSKSRARARAHPAVTTRLCLREIVLPPLAG